MGEAQSASPQRLAQVLVDNLLAARVVSADGSSARSKELEECGESFRKQTTRIRAVSEKLLEALQGQKEASPSGSKDGQLVEIDDGLLGIRYCPVTNVLELVRTDDEHWQRIAILENQLFHVPAPIFSMIRCDAESMLLDDDGPYSTRLSALLLWYFLYGLSASEEKRSRSSLEHKLAVIVGLLWGNLQIRRGQELAKTAKKVKAGQSRSIDRRSKSRAQARMDRFRMLREQTAAKYTFSIRDACRRIAEEELPLDPKVPEVPKLLRRQDSRAKAIEKQLRKRFPAEFPAKPKK
jgi:hypothetical protein